MKQRKLSPKNNRRLVLISIILIAGLFVAFSVIYHIRYGYIQDIDVKKDAYVFEYTPSTNYGGSDYLYVGNLPSGKTEAYYQFDVSSLPDGWVEARIILFFDDASGSVDVGVNFTDNGWSEETITWNDKPIQNRYMGHLINDGFNFYIPLSADDIINGKVSVCLYGKRGDADGYIRGSSKEGALDEDEVPLIRLKYEGMDPLVVTAIVLGSVVTCGIIALFIYLELRKVPSAKKNRYIPHRQPFQYSKPYKVIVTEERKINEYITLKLENGRTYIYVNGKKFIQCIRLILNIPKSDIPQYDEIDSIDEAAKLYSNHVFQNRIIRGRMAAHVPNQSHDLTAEQEFWGHCSNIQAWVEHNYDTRILMSNISFPLLRELTMAGDPLARRIFKEEIALRLESGYPSVVQYLINQGYLKQFTSDEFKTILDTTDLILNLSNKPSTLFRFLSSCVSKFPNLLEDIVLKILKLSDGKQILLSSISISTMRPFLTLNYRNSSNLLLKIKEVLQNLFHRVGAHIGEDIIDCLHEIESKIQAQAIDEPAFFRDSRREFITRKYLLDQIAFGEAGIEDVAQNLREFRSLRFKCSYCGKIIPKGKITCDWCGHRNDDDDEGYFPYPYIFRPPGGGGGANKGTIAVKIKI